MTIALAAQYTQRACTWTTWKGLLAVKSGIHQYDEDTSTYTIWFYDGPEVIFCTIWKDAVPYSVIAGGYTQEQNDADKSDFETKYKSTANAQLVQRITGEVVPELPAGRRCDHYTPNFCDKTTWYQDSERVVDASMQDSGNHILYTLSTPCFVADLNHGKIFGEDSLFDTYGAIVKVDGQIKTETIGASGGDFSLDHRTGNVTFVEELAGTETVTMTYSKVLSSLHKVCAPDGYKLRVAYIEVQLSKNIGIRDTLIFQMWGLADVFAPGQFPPGTMIPISGEERYKTLKDYICDAEKAYPPIPVFTGDGDAWRMTQQEMYLFRFDYVDRAVTDMYSTYGMEIRVWLENDTEFDGDIGIGTFYGTKEEENL